MVSTQWNKFSSKYYRWCPLNEINFDSVYFMPLTLSGRSLIKIQYSSFSVIPPGILLLHSNALQYYVKRKKCKVNDVIFPSGCEARTNNLGNKNLKISIFPGGTSVGSKKNIFTDISRYPTGKHEINRTDFSLLGRISNICLGITSISPFPTAFSTL